MPLFSWFLKLIRGTRPNLTRKIPRLKAEWQICKNELRNLPQSQQARLEAWGRKLWRKLEGTHYAAQRIVTSESDPTRMLVAVDNLLSSLEEEVEDITERVEENVFRDPPSIQSWRRRLLERLEHHLENLGNTLEAYEP